jgi:hypothetical protein
MPEGRSILSRLRLPFRHSRVRTHNTASRRRDNALFQGSTVLIFSKVFAQFGSTTPEMSICWLSQPRPIDARMSGHHKNRCTRSGLGEGSRGIRHPLHGRDGSMNHGGRGVPGARGEAMARLAAGDLTGRAIGLAINVRRTAGPGRLEQTQDDCLRHQMALNAPGFQPQAERHSVQPICV